MILKLKKGRVLFILLAINHFSIQLSAQGLNINNGGRMVVNGSANVVINNAALVNSGTFIPGTGTVNFTGTAAVANTFIGGSSNTLFYNLNIDKAGGGAKLMQNIGVSNIVFMTHRNLDLNGFDLNMGNTGNMSSEGEGSYIFGPLGGFIIRAINLNAPVAINPGNMGLEITTESNLGASVIKRGHTQQVTSSGFSLNRYFDVTYANNVTLDASLKFFYLNAELAGITESELKLWGSANQGSSWMLRDRDSWDVTTNYVSKNNVTELKRVTLASSVNNPLPVSLLYFNGQLENNLSKLTWATSAEVNNDHFELQRSSDGRNFSAIAIISGAGTSTLTHNYSYLDKEPFSNSMYYRLKQVNRDGTITYSKIVAVNTNTLFNNRLVQVFPNPTTGPVTVTFTSSVSRQVTIQLTDLKGKILSNRVVDASKGMNQVSYSMIMLAQGTYFLRIVGIDEKAFKIFKY